MTLNKNLNFSLLVFVYLGCDDLYNQGNEISAIIASDSTVKGGLEVYLKCEATDLDKDKLSYLWQCPSGFIQPLADSAIWTAPLDSGVYFINADPNTKNNDIGKIDLISKKGGFINGDTEGLAILRY